MPAVVKYIYRSGHVTPPAAVNMLTAAGKGARRGKATIYRDLLAAADAFARRGKAKTTAAQKHSVVVGGGRDEAPPTRALLL